MCQKYNGWNSYETWAVKLWLDNDQGMDELMREYVQDARDNPVNNSFMDYDSRVRLTLSDMIKDYIEEENNNPLANEASLYSDLLNAALGSVDYYEIAQAYLDDNPVTETDNETEED